MALTRYPQPSYGRTKVGLQGTPSYIDSMVSSDATQSDGNNMTEKAIDWEKINKNLPYAKTRSELVRRRELWRAMDVNDNGFLSLAEVTRSVSCSSLLTQLILHTLQGSQRRPRSGGSL